MAMVKGLKILEKDDPPNPYGLLLEHKLKEESLLLERGAVAILSRAETDSVRKSYSKLADAYACLGVLQINAGNTALQYLVVVQGCYSVGKIGDLEIFRVTNTAVIAMQYVSEDRDKINDDKTSEIRKLLNSGTFYFSYTTNSRYKAPLHLTLCAQRKNRTSETDNRFFWNRMLHLHFLRFSVDVDSWLVKLMCGSVEIRTVYVRTRKAIAAVISRLSSERTGTRFNVRGLNDEGHVANFVETEQFISIEDEVVSYVQIRGSLPLFWEQPGIQVGSHKVRISRGYEASKEAFDRHMKLIKYRYGRQAIVNLLGTNLIGSKEGESTLSNEFQKHHQESKHKADVLHIVFDYHQECRGGNTSNLKKVKNQLKQFIDEISFYHGNGDDIFSLQKGTIRTNCLDCLDRTNCVQTYFGLDVLVAQLGALKLLDMKQVVSRFEEVFKQMWVNNGNEISKIYAGTGAIQGDSKLMDGARSAARTIKNNLMDNTKQEAIEMLLQGSICCTELNERAKTVIPYLLNASPYVLREMCRRFNEYTEPFSLKVVVGTYNVNGGKHFRSVVYKDASLSDWLLDYGNSGDDEDITDIFAIGFEEIVDLNASNIVASSSENAKAWAEELQKVLSRDRPYVLVTYQQLVGICLYLFVRPEIIPFIRDVAVDSVKTGLGGHTGNKGAAAIRLLVKATSLCFVCAHFAAGQSQVTERNADYAEITRKINFSMGRTLNSHEYLFWCGDFNYRVDMDKEEIKEFIRQGNYSKIIQNDQLKKQQEISQIFKNFNEGEINFPPTYKYDLFSDDYDTSEKCRAPAYTDRVLWRRRPFSPESVDQNFNSGSLMFYGRADLKQSDHRPVVAVMKIEGRDINFELRNHVLKEVLTAAGPPDATIVLRYTDSQTDGTFEENIISAVLETISTVTSDISLVRFVDDAMLITFEDPQSALRLADLKQISTSEHTFDVALKTTNWRHQFSFKLCKPNSIPLYEPEYNRLGIPEVKPSPPRRPPPPGTPGTRPSSMIPSPTVSTGDEYSRAQQQYIEQCRYLAKNNPEKLEELLRNGFGGIHNINDIIDPKELSAEQRTDAARNILMQQPPTPGARQQSPNHSNQQSPRLGQPPIRPSPINSPQIESSDWFEKLFQLNIPDETPTSEDFSRKLQDFSIQESQSPWVQDAWLLQEPEQSFNPPAPASVLAESKTNLEESAIYEEIVDDAMSRPEPLGPPPPPPRPEPPLLPPIPQRATPPPVPARATPPPPPLPARPR